MNNIITSILATKNKKGHSSYTKYRQKLLANIVKSKEEEKVLTVFDRLKNKGETSSGKTIFSKLKYLSKDK